MGLALLALAACAGVSPRPEVLAAQEPPPAAADVDPAHVTAGENEARLLLSGRRFGAAIAAARAVLALDPRSARARAVLGLAQVQSALAVDPPDLFGQHQGDGETQLALRLSPQDPLVARLRGETLAAIGHLAAAAAVAEEALARQAPSDLPDYVELVEAAAQWRYELGEEQSALPHLQELARRRPDDAAAHFRIGSCLLRTATDAASAAAASRAFARCAELSPGDDDAHLAVVAALARAAELAHAAGDEPAAKTHVAAAERAAAAAAERFAQSAEAEFRLGVLAEQREDGAAARAAYRRALDRDPQHLGALLNLARLLAPQDQDPAVARDLWRRALAIDAERGGLDADERRNLQARVGS